MPGSRRPGITFVPMGRALRRTFPSRMAPKSGQSVQAKKPQPCQGKVWVPTGSFFDRGFTGVILLRSRQIWYQNFGHLMHYKHYFDHFPSNLQRKKLFPKKCFFQDPQKHVFRECGRCTRQMNNFPKFSIGCIIVLNFSPIGSAVRQKSVLAKRKC